MMGKGYETPDVLNEKVGERLGIRLETHREMHHVAVWGL